MSKSDGREPSRFGRAEVGVQASRTGQFAAGPEAANRQLVLYLYGVARPQVAGALREPGVDGCHPVTSCTCRNLAAIISEVSPEDFCGPAAEAHLQDLAWLGPRACRHEAIVEDVMRLSPILPARFGTLFSSLESLEEFLTKRRPAIRRFLDRVTDKGEWVIKGMVNRKKARDEIFARRRSQQNAGFGSLSPGARYLYEQKMLAGVEKELTGWLSKSCDDFIKSFGYRPADVCRRRILPAMAVEKDLETVLNCAFLAPRGAVTRLRAGISRANARYAQRGLVFALSGPWPPYSFCSSLHTSSQA